MKVDKAAKLKLKNFMESNFSISDLRKAGFFNKNEMGRYDYEKMAARICWFFSYKTVYEYGPVCRGKSCSGNCKQPSKYCNSFDENTDILFWNKLEIDPVELISKDKYLN